MATDYIPRPDTDFLSWAEIFSGYLTANYEALGMTLDDAILVSTYSMTFGGDYTAHMSVAQSATAAKEKKNAISCDG